MGQITIDRLTSRESILKALIHNSNFKVFSNYRDILRAEGFVLESVIGDPYKFLGQGKFNHHGLTLLVGVGGDNGFAIYQVSFEPDDDTSLTIRRRVSATCSLTEEIGICFKYEIELLERGWNTHFIFTPEIAWTAQVRYKGVEQNITGQRSFSLPPWNTRYRVTNPNGQAIEVYANDLDILTVDGTYIPVIDYSLNKPHLSEPVLTKDNQPALIWPICWVDNMLWHRWGTRKNQTIPPISVQKEEKPNG